MLVAVVLLVVASAAARCLFFHLFGRLFVSAVFRRVLLLMTLDCRALLAVCAVQLGQSVAVTTSVRGLRSHHVLALGLMSFL